MIIENKMRRYRPSIGDRVYFDSITILRNTAQRSLLTIDPYGSDLGVRHSQRLHQMFDGLTLPKFHKDCLIFLLSSQKVDPAVLEDKDFPFYWPTLEAALRHLLAH